MVKFFHKNIDYKLPSQPSVKQWVRDVLAGYDQKEGRIQVVLTDDPFILEMNRNFLGHDYFTDIITFDTSGYPDAPKDSISGELYISVDTVRANAEEYGVSFAEEMHRVIIHGVLHLIGFDDHEAEDIKEMRAAEARALEQLNQYGITI